MVYNDLARTFWQACDNKGLWPQVLRNFGTLISHHNTNYWSLNTKVFVVIQNGCCIIKKVCMGFRVNPKYMISMSWYLWDMPHLVEEQSFCVVPRLNVQLAVWINRSYLISQHIQCIFFQVSHHFQKSVNTKHKARHKCSYYIY